MLSCFSYKQYKQQVLFDLSRILIASAAHVTISAQFCKSDSVECDTSWVLIYTGR